MSQNYYTYRIQIANKNHVQVTVSDSHEGSTNPDGKFGYKGALRKKIDALSVAAQTDKLKDEQVKALGEALCNALFDSALLRDFINLYNKVVQEKSLLRIELDIDEVEMPEVAALPWEFMRLPEEAKQGTFWFGTTPHLIFLRRRRQWNRPAPIQLEADQRLKLALVVSDPENRGDLAEVVYKALLTDLQKFVEEYPERLELLPLDKQASPETIDEILRAEPHIFHFIGHGRLVIERGEAVREVALVDDFDEPMWVASDYFSDLFNRHRPGVVLLQSCQSATSLASHSFVSIASTVVQQQIPVVVAMQYDVTNSTATRFAAGDLLSLAVVFCLW